MNISFVATVIDQLDFALDHVLLADANYKRLALMLVDNVLELALHNHALDRKRDLRWGLGSRPPPEAALIAEATGQHFDAKVRLARSTGWMTENVARAVTILHGYRNELYHAGLAREEILHELAVLYLQISCDLMKSMPHVGYSHDNKLKIPHRARKYLGVPPLSDVLELVPAAWDRLCEVAHGVSFQPGSRLQEDLRVRVDEVDRLIDYLAEAENSKIPRDKVVRDCQAWHIAFTEAGRKFLFKARPTESTVAGIVDHIANNYPFPVKGDPIMGWRKRLRAVGEEADPLLALEKYYQMLTQVEPIQEAVSASAAALDAEVDGQIERSMLAKK